MLTRSLKCVVALCPRFQFYKPISYIATAQLKLKQTRKPLLWQTNGLIQGKKAPTQLLFQEALQKLFPTEKILFNVRKLINIKPPDSEEGYLEVDAYIPHFKFPLEFQDPYHYCSAVYYSNKSLKDIQKIDQFKKRALDERGEPLLQIPCWWDGTVDSLAATIKAFRPDLLRNLTPSSPPIATTKPSNFFQDHVISGMGTPMRPVFYTKQYFIRGKQWSIGEKYDGVRGIWNPNERALFSRFGNKLYFTEVLANQMPDFYLDCEIWFGCGNFQEAAKLRADRTVEVDWSSFRLMVLDIANQNTKHLSYIERYQKLSSIIDCEHPFLILSPQAQLENEKQRNDFESLVARHGGEGVILRELNSPYGDGYTSSVLKIKPTRDMEALVVSRDNKSLTVELTDKTTFRMLVPSERQRLPKIGDVITIAFSRYVHGSTLPYRPEILRVRSDVTWDEVVAYSNHDHSGKRNLGRDFSERWDIDLDDVRGYFTSYAQKYDFDPFVPDNWYKLRGEDILAEKGAKNMLKPFNESYIDAVMVAFPELKWNKSKFSYLQRNYWKDIANVKKFLEDFAKDKGLDPLDPDNWYNTKVRDIAQKGGWGLLDNFNNSHVNALIAAFPDIGLNKAKFSTAPRHYWNDKANVRKFFEEFANEKGFDPLEPNNWYIFTRPDIVAKKGGWGMLRQFKQSHVRAIIATYPKIGLNKANFYK